MTITQQKKIELRKKAHHLNPVIMIGNKGLTEAVHMEIERALIDHELIKIKIAGGDKEDRQEITDAICLYHEADLIQSIGHTITVYRESEEE